MPPRELDAEAYQHQQRILFQQSSSLSELSEPRTFLRQRYMSRDHSRRVRHKMQTTGTSTIWIRRLWQLHFIVSVSILLFGIASNNGSRKYIPIEPLQVGENCERAFLNSLASSKDDLDSTVCCDPLSSETASDLCSKTSLPLSDRLSRFPEAWLLPLVPWLVQWLSTVRLVDSFSLVFSGPAVFLWRRLFLYLSVILLRGLVLYQGMNQMEDHVLRPLPETCWYREWLRPDQPACYGRIFDFSDHIVLYFAQLLPLALMESLDAFTTTKSRWIRAVLVLGTLYLYSITLLSAFTTTAYFHTAPEILAGYAVSLVIQLPLYALQCGQWPTLHAWFFARPFVR